MARRGCRTNAELSAQGVRRHCRLDGAAETLLGHAMERRRVSARGYHRLLRVARTAADLDGQDAIGPDHVATALLMRAQP